ncbi:MAG: class I SAM-dependent methyltransferase [Lentisphaerae bacterium]|nr:class I SAM-dependent methyltransferase [Lentisphaerota bacterium]
MFVGTEIAFDPRLSKTEKVYIRLLGAPISGLRIRVRRVLPALTGSCESILDAGCGLGVFSFEMAKRFKAAKVLGIDMDAEQIAANKTIARQAGLANLSFAVQDATRLTFDNEFDLILSVDVIEHVEDDLSVCRGICKALKPGGRLIMHVPAMYRWWIIFGKRLNFTHEKGHVRPGYTPVSISELLARAGLVVDDVKYTYGWLETVTNNIANIISRGSKSNKWLYALVFPLLLFISYWGQFSNPKEGSGVLVRAHKKNDN